MAAAGSSRFAVTSGLLRPYMREHQKQQLSAVHGQVPPPLPVTKQAEKKDGRTLQLFPLCAGMPLPSQKRAPKLLTIIFEGLEHVLENFPADKVKELIQVARSLSAAQAPEKGAPAVPEKPAATEPTEEAEQPLAARTATLQRFLEKRKGRSSTTDPYYRVPENDVAACQPAKDQLAASWLTL